MQQYLLQDLVAGVVVRLRGREGAIQSLLADVTEELLEKDGQPRPNKEYFSLLQDRSSEYDVDIEPFVDVGGLLE